MDKKSVVILVDHKNRDLLGATLIARHLENRGVRCHLEPLESYYGCLAAFNPSLILFNHINSSHLVKYSQRLKRLGVLTAVLPNEGILYSEEALRYNAGRFHKGSHIDFYFCWNEAHRKALLDEMPGGSTSRFEVCGVPRFDFYVEPWNALHRRRVERESGRPRLLVCTNLAMARYIGLSESDAARFFQPFLRIGAYRDYKSLIACHGRAREKLMLYLGKLAEVGLYDLVLRPHPRETPDFYLRTMADWSPQMRERVTVDSSSGISELIMNCDLEISCETCTTALEAWIVGKPTVELVFERHPTFFHEEPSALNVLCDKPEDLLRIVSAALEHPDQLGFRAGRQQHLEKWCYSADGKSSERIAEVIASAVHAKEKPSCDYTINERRKGMKLLALRKMNLPYSFDPLLWLKAGIAPKSYSTKKFVYSKTIRPSDVVEARLMLDKMSNLAGL